MQKLGTTLSPFNRSSLTNKKHHGFKCLCWFSILNKSFWLFDSILCLIRFILSPRFDYLGIIVVNTFLSLVAFQKYLSIIFHIDLFPHKFLIGIISYSIISFQKFRILKPQDIEDSTILQNIILKLSSFLLPNDFEYIQSIKQNLFLLVSWNINQINKTIIIFNYILFISFNVFKSDLNYLVMFPFSRKFHCYFNIFSCRYKTMYFYITSKTILDVLGFSLG